MNSAVLCEHWLALHSVKLCLSPLASVENFAIDLSTEVSFFIEIGDHRTGYINGFLNKS